MAYRIEKSGQDTDIIIDGFEKGIAASPELGLADIRGANITSVPGEVSVSFATTAATIPPVGITGATFSAVAATGVFTVSSTANYYNGMAVTIASASTTPTISALVVGGGGAGGGGSSSAWNGGGGAGGFQTASGINLGVGSYAVTVGAGGVGISGQGPSGGNSTFQATTAVGGGGGGSNGGIGANGASGGGGSNTGTSSTSAGGTGIAGQGNAGGTGGNNSIEAGGGGGGATGAGTNGITDGGGTSGQGGTGGAGTASSISGSSVTYAGGGGGAGVTVGGAGGTGGGGAGATTSGAGTAGTLSKGGGGGGTVGAGSGANGGSGVVILSYTTGSMTAVGGVKTTSGGNTIHTFVATTADIALSGTISGGATSGTLSTAWPYATASQTVLFSAGETRVVTFTNSSTAITWTGALVNSAATITIPFQITAVDLVVGSTAYVGNITGTTFKLYSDPTLYNLVTLISATTGTYTVPSFGVAVWSTYYQPDLYTFLLDTSGNAWYLTASLVTGNVGGNIAASSLQYMGNTGHSSSGSGLDFGLVAWKNYLFVIINTNIDYIEISNFIAFAGAPGPTVGPNGNWVYGWKTDLTASGWEHQAIAGTDDAVYICNSSAVASILQNAGTTFNPVDSSTYTYNTAALSLPTYDHAQCLAQLGPTLLVGGTLAYIYPWDRISTSNSYPLICADSGIVRIVSTNSNSYVFAGTRGRIYVTNGQQIQLYSKIPDSLTGNPEPYFTWQDALYSRNKLYFTFTATDNAGNALSTMGGIWAVGIDAGQTVIQLPTAGSLYNANQLSYGTYGGSCPVLFYSQLSAPAGYGIGGAWVNSTTYGVDVSSTLPYTNYQTYVDTDIIPIGTYYKPTTNRQIEYKLSKPLVTGESIKVYWRGNLTDAFTLVWTSTVTGQVSDASQVNFQKQQWAQFRVALASTATTPSYNRFRELRLR